MLLFVLAITGITYAAFTWRSSDVSISGNTECFTINYNPGPTVVDADVLLFDESKIISNNTITIKNGMALTSLAAGIDSDCNINGKLTVTMAINTLNDAYTDNGECTGAFKYVLASYDPATYNTISVNDLKDKTFDIVETGSITSTSSITLIDENMSNELKGYLIIFYVDGDLAQNDASDSTFSATITGVVTQTE